MNIPDEIQRAADQGALFVMNDSGGKDSQASGIRLQGIAPPAQQLFLHATLGESEWPGALEQAAGHARRAGAAFMVVQAKRTLLEHVEQRFLTRPEVPSWPSAAARFCTSTQKRDVLGPTIKRYAAAHGYTTVVNVMGLRAEESRARATLAPCAVNTRQTLLPRNFKNGRSTPGRAWLDFLPIHDLRRDEVFGLIADSGQTPHHAYALGNERMSCVLCVLGCMSDARNGARHNPALYQKYARLEARIGWTFSPGRKTLPQLTGVPLDD